ncbi:hypothetical protein ABZ942_32855 [Nocardia sp. NPDC046473]|uniref:hypothetical protein n=1 Tax=Nocardia sp. NPDC046473 TaxID=3155733 RepID=UPI0033ECCB64
MNSASLLAAGNRNDMSDTLPNPAADDSTRFEAAPDPDGTLIPIPAEAPPGKPIRDDAHITISERGENGYYVSIYNGPPDPPDETIDVINELLTEYGREEIEGALLTGAGGFMRFALGTGATVLASVLTTSPLLNEYFARGTMDDGTQVTYVILTPKE